MRDGVEKAGRKAKTMYKNETEFSGLKRVDRVGVQGSKSVLPVFSQLIAPRAQHGSL